jgi:GAF domain-containing protein
MTGGGQATFGGRHEAGDSGETSGLRTGSETVRSVDGHLGELIIASHRVRSRSELFRVFTSGVADGLAADLTQILEYASGRGDFILRAGHGFRDELLDQARVPCGLLSQAGRAMLDPEGQPVELTDFSRSHEWSDDELLKEHGAKSGVVVKIESGERDFGTLGAFYSVPRSFEPEEVRFLTCAASLLGLEIERLRRGDEASAWLSRYELLRAGAALLRVPAERDEILSAASIAAVNGAPSCAPMADWCFVDALESAGRLPSLRRVAVENGEGDVEHLGEAFSAPLSPNALHGAPRVYATRQTELVRSVDDAFISEVAKDSRHHRAIVRVQPKSYVCAPVIGDKHFHGAVTLLRTETGNSISFEQEDRAAITEFATLIGQAIEMGMAETDKIVEAEEPDFPSLQLRLTDREYDVLEGIAGGERLGELGGRLCISTNTVRTHKRHLCQKIGLPPSSSNSEIVAEARRLGFLMQPAIHAERRR